MRKQSHILPSLIFTLLILPLYGFNCAHDHKEFPLKFVSLPSHSQGRSLQTSQRDNMRIFSFFELDGVNETAVSMFKDQLMPAVISYYEATLKVNRVENMQFDEDALKQCGSKNPPAELVNGMQADFAVLVTYTEDTSSSFLAVAGPCLIDTETNRPVMGVVTINTAYTWGTTEKEYESNLIAVMHEMGHAFGFSSGMFPYWMDPSTGTVLANPTTTKNVNGGTVTVLQVEPLRTKLRDYFACPGLEGAYMENEGGTGSAGSHFERRVFFNDILTASVMVDQRVSEFYLAALEGTGWYTPDYNMAEPFFWGKGKGCNFLDTTCLDGNGDPRWPDHFCASGSSDDSCTFTAIANGVCRDTDPFSDGCPYPRPYTNRYCADSSSAFSAAYGEFVGEGSMCFTTTNNGGSDVFSCYAQTCQSVGSGSYEILVAVGEKNVTCTAAGSVTVSEYGITFDCPDPDVFCTTSGLKYCPRGCMGRGDCVDGECKCYDGFYGRGCSYQGSASVWKRVIRWVVLAIGVVLAISAAVGIGLWIKMKKGRTNTKARGTNQSKTPSNNNNKNDTPQNNMQHMHENQIAIRE